MSVRAITRQKVVPSGNEVQRRREIRFPAGGHQRKFSCLETRCCGKFMDPLRCISPIKCWIVIDAPTGVVYATGHGAKQRLQMEPFNCSYTQAKQVLTVRCQECEGPTRTQ